MVPAAILLFVILSMNILLSAGPIASLIQFTLFGVLFAWAVVSWHRFVMLGEFGTGILPPVNVGAIGAYLWKFFLLIGAISFLFLIMLIGLDRTIGLEGLNEPLFNFGITRLRAFAYLFTLPLTYVFLRLSIILPATAIGQPLKFRVSWGKTSEFGSVIWILTIAVLGLIVVGLFLFQYVLGTNTSFVIACVVYSPFIVLTLSVISNLYSLVTATT